MSEGYHGGKIYSAVAAMVEEVGSVGKDGFNASQKYSFRSIDDVYNAVHPVMAKHKVFATSEVLSNESTSSGGGKKQTTVLLKMRYTFHTTDGSSVQTEVVSEAVDWGDKATNKAMSFAYKYALFQMLCIPVEVIDGDADSPPSPPPPPEPSAPEIWANRIGEVEGIPSYRGVAAGLMEAVGREALTADEWRDLAATLLHKWLGSCEDRAGVESAAKWFEFSKARTQKSGSPLLDDAGKVRWSDLIEHARSLFPEPEPEPVPEPEAPAEEVEL